MGDLRQLVARFDAGLAMPLRTKNVAKNALATVTVAQARNVSTTWMRRCVKLWRSMVSRLLARTRLYCPRRVAKISVLLFVVCLCYSSWGLRVMILSGSYHLSCLL